MDQDGADLTASISHLLRDSDYRSGVADLRRQINEQSPLSRRRIAHMLAALKDSREIPIDEHARVFVAKVLVALLPTSFETIRVLLQQCDPTEINAELQFSVFVALTDLPAIEGTQPTLEQLTSLIGTYLLQARSNAAHAAWMAGDLLGDHWPPDMAFPVLLKAAREGESIASRRSAIHGLSHMLVAASKRRQWDIVDALRAIARESDNPEIRTAAESAIGNLRGL